MVPTITMTLRELPLLIHGIGLRKDAELLPQGLVAYDKVVARRQFMLLSKLAQQVDCYRLYFGRNVEELPHLIDPLLEGRGR